MITNRELSEVLEAIALLMELDAEQPFRLRAYRGAADEVMAIPDSVAEMLAAGKDLTELQGVGKGIAARIAEIVPLGRDAYLEQLEKEYAPGLLRLLKVPGLGPKRVRTIRDGLGISSPEAVKEAAEAGKLRDLPGFGEKTEATILRRVNRALSPPE
ncbi:MAG: helix-hairpin-helix domain-containing protein [Planctomycetota bacterium]|nr:helix-hairpin-helix domain-containing protein [Planctomycetota bacterium]